MLARERPAELDDEVGDALGDAAHPGDVARLARVQRGADVQAADRRVPVEAGPRPLALQQLLEAHDELLEPVRPHGGVLDERDGLRRVRAAEQQREDRRAQAHRLRLVGGVGQQRDVVGADVAADRLRRCEPLGDLLRRPAPLDEQQGGRIAVHERGAVAPEAVRAGVVDRDVVEQLDGARALAQDERRRAGRRGERRELQRRHPADGRQRVQADVGAGRDGERALAAADEAREIQRVGVQQRVEAVAGDAAQDVRVAAADLVAVAVGELQARPQEPGEAVAALRPADRLRARHRREVDRRAVAQDAAQAEHLVAGAAVDDRAHPGGVVADHPAERRDGRRRGVGAEDEPVGRGVGVEVGLDEPGLHAGARGAGVELQQPVHRARVEHEARRGRLAGEARAGAAGGDGHAGRTGRADRAAHVGLRAREHDADRVAAVDRRVRRPERARHRVGAQLAVQPPVERRVQPFGGSRPAEHVDLRRLAQDERAVRGRRQPSEPRAQLLLHLRVARGALRVVHEDAVAQRLEAVVADPQAERDRLLGAQRRRAGAPARAAPACGRASRRRAGCRTSNCSPSASGSCTNTRPPGRRTRAASASA